MSLKPLPYHEAVSRHLMEEEKGLWSWFSSDKFSAKYIEAAKLELLKSTYRLSKEDHESIYAIAETAQQQLDIQLPLTIYQAQGASNEANAALVFFEDELTLVLVGNIIELLDEQELLALFGHEFAHHKLYSLHEGIFFSAARLLDWCCSQVDCQPAYYETYRRFQIYTEIFADLGALEVSKHLEPAIAALVKVSTGLKEVSAVSYLAQADEILKLHDSGSEGVSHPEMFLRAKVLEIMSRNDFSVESIERLVEHDIEANNLDILGQKQLSTLTGEMIDTFTADSFLRTEHAEVIARQYFPSFTWHDTITEHDMLSANISRLGNSSKQYLCYVLLDFATVDPDGENVGLAASLIFAEKVGLSKQYEPVARKELKFNQKDLAQLKRFAPDLIAKASHD